MKSRHVAGVLLLLLFHISSNAQQTFPINGISDERENYYAFTNARIYKSYNTFIDSATLIIRKGKIVSVGKNLNVPNDAVVVDLGFKTIYPGFIDIYTSYGMPESKPSKGFEYGRNSNLLPDRKGAYAGNDALKCEFSAIDHFTTDVGKAKQYLEAGFCAVNTHRMDGISRGSSALVSLADQRENLLIIKDKTAHHLSFSKGSSTQAYPGSLMGIIAVLRQTYLDGEWYARSGYKEQYNLTLASWNDLQKLPQIIECNDKLNELRALKIAEEYNKSYILKGGGNEYQRIDELKGKATQIILPVNFPDAYDVEDPNIADRINLTDMRHWELAPSNPKILSDAGIEITLTTSGLDKISSFKSKILECLNRGMSKEAILKAITYNPASWLGALDKIGALDAGKLANFFICDGDYFDKNSKILQTWSNGEPTVFSETTDAIRPGKYKLSINNDPIRILVFEKDGLKYKSFIQVNDTSKINVNNTINRNIITLSFVPDQKTKKFIRLNGTVYPDKLIGSGYDITGNAINWKADFISDIEKSTKPSVTDTTNNVLVSAIVYPWDGYGWKEKPVQKDYLIKNATIWTCEKEEVLNGYDLLIKNGKIDKIGKNLSSKGAIEIDASGKHVSPGIIDEHSHIAIQGGVNECTQPNTAEVRIGDVVNCDDVNIYRQLSGGVVAAQLLHGSCNPIGGQSAIIKLRWGYAPEKMKIENADGFIKFALGENVKNSRSSFNTRFPDTRMGVEQIYRDAFTRAQEYLAAKKNNTLLASQRKDIELETLVEILTSKRFITCHSYVQSEINMLMHVADDFGFKVNTFTHILEGYKVADKMKKHQAGASTFADWWAYKYEVIDAIPHNSGILHDMGITTAINSDDAEMARRLNQEAAKAIKYSEMSPTEALKMVTINPAKLLHLDGRMGSIKEGKDADIVIWSASPLSIYAIAEMTFVDGIKFFDRNEMEQQKKLIDEERNALIQKMLAFKKSGGKTELFTSAKKIQYHCDTIGEGKEESIENH